MLPGLIPHTRSGATGLSFVSSATSQTSSVTGPASIASGYMLIYIDSASNASGTPTDVTPSGFTLSVATITVTGVRFNISHKIADGSEASAGITGMNGTNSNRKVLLVFKRSSAIVTITASAAFSSGFTDGDPALQTITASGGTLPQVVIAVTATTDPATPVFTMSPTADATVVTSSNNRLKTGYIIQNASGANVTIDTDDNGSNNLAFGIYYQAA